MQYGMLRYRMNCVVTLAFLSCTAISALLADDLEITKIRLDETELRTWMDRFKEDPFFQHDYEPTTTTQKRAETFVNESEDAFYSFRDEILKNLTTVFNSKIRYFPANVLMIQAMYRLMRPGGVLEQEGFHGYGYVKTDGRAMVIFGRSFATEHDLLTIMNKSLRMHLTDLQVALGDFDKKKPLVAVTNYILGLTDLAKLQDWLDERQKTQDAHIRHTLAGQRVRLIIEYSCCSKTAMPLLKPRYGTLVVKVG